MSGMDGIEERLRSHAHAFDSLLDLIPAKVYMGEDNSNQWKKRKQTKEESQRAKKAKLDPDCISTAKEVLDRKSSKSATKAEEETAAAADSDDELAKGSSPTKPTTTKSKKKKNDAVKLELGKKPSGEEDKRAGEASKSSKKDKAKKKERKGKGKETEKGKGKLTNGVVDGEHDDDQNEQQLPNGWTSDLELSSTEAAELGNAISGETDDKPAAASESSTATDRQQQQPQLNGVDTAAHDQKPDTKRLPVKDPTSQQQLKERLAARIAALRAERKADSDSQPRNRSELMEQRRQREEARKERKKQVRLQKRAEELKEASAARSSPLAEPAEASAASTRQSGKGSENFQFGQVLFSDGDKLNSSLDTINRARKRRGPTDTAGAIKRVEATNARLEGMDDEKRATIFEKDRWNKAHKLVRGEKLQDDEGLLRKSMKRQEKQKKKSEKQWSERIDNVAKSKTARQKKRENNLAARREQKQLKKSGQLKKSKKKLAAGKDKKKNKGGKRAGFEGTMFGGGGSKKKK